MDSTVVRTAVRTAALLIVTGLGVATSNPSAAQDRRKPRESLESLIARSKVWTPNDIPSMNLRTGPSEPGSFALGETMTCDYVDKQLSGMSPKFACRLPNGDELKVKYGGDNGEVYGEVAASRLLWALGFGADRMYSVRVICRGCPAKVGGILRNNGERIIDPATVERKLGARELTDKWGWDELDRVDPSKGGATRAERDALKLLAVVLQHSDSKARQQRIVCLDGAESEEGRCAAPLMMVNDLGVTFGRANAMNQQPGASVNLADWAGLPVWKTPDACIGNLAGSWTGTLKEPVISEEGRQFLADRLVQLSDQQLRDMFEAARVNLRPRAPGQANSGFPSADEWVNAFKQKRTEFVERRCAA